MSSIQSSVIFLINHLFLLFIFTSCGIQKQATDGYAHFKPVSPIKLKYSDELTFEFKLYEQDDSTVQIYFDILNENLLLKRDSSDQWTRNASLEIAVKKNGVSREAYSKASKNWTLHNATNFIDSITLNVPIKEDIYLSTLFTDLNKHVYFENQNWWIREKSFVPEQFLLVNPRTKKPFVQHFAQEDTLLIRSHKFANTAVNITQFRNLSSPAIAAFSLSNAEPDFSAVDSSFAGVFDNNLIQIYAPNCLSILSDPTEKSQSIAFFTNKSTELDVAIQCMAYICSAAELQKLKDPEVKNVVFEQFWIKAGGNDILKVNHLKEEFLKRIDFSNKNFSSFKLGALTDLGMIYIVFGEPIKIEKDGYQQNWYYSLPNNEQIKFTFLKDESYGIPNNYFLERASNYRSFYYIAVEQWRNGMIE